MVVWYVVSLLALWANKFLVSTIAIDTSLLSMMQLVMSVACGALVEVRAVGAAKFAVDLRGAFIVTQLQLYSSLVAMGLQAIYVVVDQAISSRRVSPDGGRLFVALCLMLNGVAYYVQSALAYRVMSLLSPVSHSVVSTLKRALLIVLSIYRYGEPATLGNYVGMMFVLGGVYLFHHASRHRSKLLVWTNHNGGTCWLKHTQGSKTTVVGDKADLLLVGPPSCGTVESNVDFEGQNGGPSARLLRSFDQDRLKLVSH
ncbi:hypothetical protein DYB38_012670 [Aphanomyces astaci]|uniref:Sugar phosphate transporter domain-containing protein n=1 Tax=Aphanomyces astaci TaxID=112090 RepID=A0A397E2B9_APHAT|nr:hypothetical protein DYB38_012670 [Aphanomyces astaci]